MANNLKPIPIQIQRDVEQTESWDGLSTPYQLLLYFARNASIDPSSLVKLDETIVSSIQPVGEDATKIWIKSDGAPAIGIPIGGTYQMFYQYPPNTPFIWTKGSSSLPSYLIPVSEDLLEDFGLKAPTVSKYFYVQLIV